MENKKQMVPGSFAIVKMEIRKSFYSFLINSENLKYSVLLYIVGFKFPHLKGQ